MSYKFNPLTSELDIVNDFTSDTLHVLKAGDTMTGALTNTKATGNSLVVDTNTLVVDATNHRVGIGTAAPATTLNVVGTLRVERVGVSSQYMNLASSGGSNVIASASGTAFEFNVGGLITMQITSTGKVFNVIGQTNPSLKIDGSAASAATGLRGVSAAAAGGFALDVISTGTNENLKIDAKGTGTITIGSVSTGTVIVGNDLVVSTAGKGLQIKEGSDAKMGTATLVAGTVTVSTTAVTANSRVFLTVQSLGTVTVPTIIGVTARTAGTSFTITSANVLDTSAIAWLLVEPS